MITSSNLAENTNKTCITYIFKLSVDARHKRSSALVYWCGATLLSEPIGSSAVFEKMVSMWWW